MPGEDTRHTIKLPARPLAAIHIEEIAVTASMACRLRRRLAELAAEHDVPGASVSVLADGEVIDAAVGTVNLRTGVEVRPDSPFMVQSITKVWTATLVMQLVDENLVDLDDPIIRYLPGFVTADRLASADITVRHLLTHTGGFEGDLWAATTADDDALKLFVDEHVARATQHVEPGRAYSYCSAGFGVLGRLVEILRGTTYATALRRYLADPLGVDGLVANAGEAMGFRTAIGHVAPAADAPLRPLPTWAVLPMSNPAAGNQLAMPARGLIEFARMHLSDGVASQGTRLLTAESARLMRTPQVGVPATLVPFVNQGLGWRITSAARVAEHGGDAPGCAAMLQLVPDQRVAVAVLGNGGRMGRLVTTLCDELLSELAGLPPRALVPVPERSPIADPNRYCGIYELRNQVAEVSTDDRRRLWLTLEERNEGAEMAALAGLVLHPETFELRKVDDERFARVNHDGEMAGVVEFVGTDSTGRARFLHDGRAAPRVC